MSLILCSTEQLFREISNFKSSFAEVFCKKRALKILAKFTGKHLCQSLFLKNAAASCNYCKLFKKIFSTEHLQTSAFLQNTFFNNIYYIPLINTYFFLLLKFFNPIAKSRQINRRIEKRET